MNLEDILLRDTRANQPLASLVPEGTLYYVTDEAVTEQSRGSAWVDYSDAGTPAAAAIDELTGDVTAGPGSGSQVATVKAAIKTHQIGITVDGGASVLTTGAKGFKSFLVAGTIIGWRLTANAAGDIEFDIKKSTYAAFPTQASIVAAAPPELVGVQKNEDWTLTGWTTAIATGDILGFEITGVPATITRVTLELTIVVS